MKIEFDKKKSIESISNLMHNTVDFGKKTMGDAKVGVNAMVEKTKADTYHCKENNLRYRGSCNQTGRNI